MSDDIVFSVRKLAKDFAIKNNMSPLQTSDLMTLFEKIYALGYDDGMEDGSNSGIVSKDDQV